MKKYFGWMFALMTSLTMIAAYADDEVCDNDNEAVAEDNDAEEQIAVIIDEDLDDQIDE